MHMRPLKPQSDRNLLSFVILSIKETISKISFYQLWQLLLVITGNYRFIVELLFIDMDQCDVTQCHQLADSWTCGHAPLVVTLIHIELELICVGVSTLSTLEVFGLSTSMYDAVCPTE